MNNLPLLSNQRTQHILSSMLAGNRLPHALLIEGEAGLGKKTLARFIAKAVLCGAEVTPCLDCKTCHLIEVGNHPDCQTIEPDGAAIKVDQIRKLRSEAYLSPLSADGRVFIINQAHTMNPNAQNALLKVLEEPPAGVVFVLLAKNASLLLETIRSRSVCLTLSPVALDEVGFGKVAQLADVSLSDAERLLCSTDGNIGQAVELANTETVFLSSLANEILTFAANDDRLKILSLLQPYIKKREMVRDLLLAIKESVAKEMKKKAVKEYSSFTAEWLNRAYEQLTHMEQQLEFNPSLPLVFCRIASILTQ